MNKSYWVWNIISLTLLYAGLFRAIYRDEALIAGFLGWAAGALVFGLSWDYITRDKP